jgi:hypothetical protein
VAIAMACAAYLALGPSSRAFECPVPQTDAGKGVIAESQAEINRLQAMLGTGDLDNRLEVLARDLKAKYPAADTTELTNFMVEAYCPVVAADPGLSDSEKDAKLTAFSQQVWGLYSR